MGCVLAGILSLTQAACSTCVQADAGVDAGIDAGVVDCQTIEASGPAGTATLSSATWSGTDLSGTSWSFNGSTYTVDIVASNTTYGSVAFELSNLVAGSDTGFALDVMTFESPASFAIQDEWSCSAGADCAASVTLTSFTGTTIEGTFSATFYTGSSASGSNNVVLNGGAFDVSSE